MRRLVAARPLVTLAGPGGGGKTRLALRVAADILAAPPGAGGSPDVPDGVWFVDLAPLADAALVPQAVAAAVGVPEVPGQELAATLAEALRPRALLLVLDNCEHLVDALRPPRGGPAAGRPRGCACSPPAASPCAPPARSSTASPPWRRRTPAARAS